MNTCPAREDDRQKRGTFRRRVVALDDPRHACAGWDQGLSIPVAGAALRVRGQFSSGR